MVEAAQFSDDEDVFHDAKDDLNEETIATND